MRLALIAGRRVAYETAGDPHGNPVLIIHGAWGGPSSTLWNGPRLRWSAPTAGLQLIWYDRRCAGLSAYDAATFTLSDLAQDAADVLDYLKLERAAVVATSAGGPIGLRLAIDHPQRVSALVLLNTGASLMSLEPSGIDFADPLVVDRLATVARRLNLIDLAAGEGIAAALAESESEWREPPQPAVELAELTELAELAGPRRNRERALRRLPQAELERLAQGALRNMQAQRGIDLSSELGGVQCPTLIVHGDADTTVPLAFGQQLAASLPAAEFVVLPGEGHGLIVNPSAQRLISEWLSALALTHVDK